VKLMRASTIGYLLFAMMTSLADAAFDALGAAKWALGCVDNCDACTCKSGGGGAGPGFCQETSTCDVKHCACGCTPFVSTALVKGGNWGGPFQTVCAEFQSYMKESQKWKEVKDIHPGDVVVMTTDKYAGHCCIGTGHGVMSCHNRAARNVKPADESHAVDGIYRHVESVFWNATDLVQPGDTMISYSGQAGSTCEACIYAMEGVFNLALFDTLACAKGVETLVKLVCSVAGPYAGACKAFVGLVCSACKLVTKDQCNWKPLAEDACKQMGFCADSRVNVPLSLPIGTSIGSHSCRTRDQVVELAKKAAHGEYSTDVCGHCGHYRCDCSGLVSYAWGLGHGDGPDTAEFLNFCDKLSHWHDLKPGDVLLKPGEHVLMFLHWVDEDAKTFKEAACHDPAEGCSVDVTSKERYEDFFPCRAKKQYICPETGTAPTTAAVMLDNSANNVNVSVSQSAVLSSDVSSRFVMPWICANTDICGNDKSIVEAQVQQLGAVDATTGRMVFTDAAFEGYTLNNGRFVRQSSAIDVANDISRQKVKTWAMVFSTSIAEMRLCWSDTESFIKSVFESLSAHGGSFVQGVNFDWEPNEATEKDGEHFAHFLEEVSNALHAKNILVSVAGIRGAPLWNYKLIGKTSVDYVMDMNTYMDGQGGNPPPDDFDYFKAQVVGCLEDLRPEQYVVCLEDNLTTNQLQHRIEFMHKHHVHKVALWLSNLANPLPEKYFAQFAAL